MTTFLGAFVLCLFLANVAPFSATNPLPPNYELFRNSPFYLPIGANPTVDQNSSAEISSLMNNGGITPELVICGGTVPQCLQHPNGIPYYFSQPTDPTYTITCVDFGGKCLASGAQVHIPARAVTQCGLGSGDCHLIVVDQANGIDWEFWSSGLRNEAGGTLNVGWGGYTKLSTNGVTLPAGAGESTVSNLAYMSGALLRYADFASGSINHAVGLTIPCASSTTYSFPAPKAGGLACTDGSTPLGMGQRIQLNLTDAQIAALKVPQWAKVLWTQAARYGYIVNDTTGIGVTAHYNDVESDATFSYFTGTAGPWQTWAQANGFFTTPNAKGIPTYYIVVPSTGINFAKNLRALAQCVNQGSC